VNAVEPDLDPRREAPPVDSGTVISATRRTLAAALLAAFALGAVGCSSEGAQTECTTSSCTITFDRKAEEARVSVLGIDARLVKVEGNRATIEVGGQRVIVPADGQAQAGDFTVSVREVTDAEVVVKVSRGGG
jgi:acyl-coenzyme A thioesterase PaaI-like protein